MKKNVLLFSLPVYFLNKIIITYVKVLQKLQFLGIIPLKLLFDIFSLLYLIFVLSVYLPSHLPLQNQGYWKIDKGKKEK